MEYPLFNRWLNHSSAHGENHDRILWEKLEDASGKMSSELIIPHALPGVPIRLYIYDFWIIMRLQESSAVLW